MIVPARRILLASHGTVGACAAEAVALDLTQAGSEIFHLTVVPDFWRGMMGDDWLNNVSTRDAYCKHVESQLAGEITRHQQSLCTRAKAAGVQYSSRVVIGKPAECLLEFAAETEPALIVVGSPRPRGVAGLRSRMRMETLVSALRAPLLVVPHPK